MLSIITEWSLVVGFLGVVIGAVASFCALPVEAKKKIQTLVSSFDNSYWLSYDFANCMR